jgi:cytochrome c6
MRAPHAAIRRLLSAIALGLLLAGTARAGDLARGSVLYRQHCTACHGPAGKPVLPGAPDFSRPTALLQSDLDLLARIRNGRGGMPAYQGQLRDRDILDIVAHLRTLK